LAWLPLLTDDVLNSLSATEQNQMTDPSSAADLAQIVVNVMNLIRGRVLASRQGLTGPPGTIPEELLTAAISIARFRFLTHLPGTQLITKERAADKDEAYAQLEAVAKGEFYVMDANNETPGPSADTGGGEDYGGTYPFWQPQTPAWPYW
jgi:Protein of unknown function (DUF1320)